MGDQSPVRLFSAFQIALATLIASPVTGFILMGLNERALSFPRRAKVCFGLSVAMIPSMILLFGLTGGSILTRLMPFIFSLILFSLFNSFQRARVRAAFEHDAIVASSVDVVAIALGLLIGLIALGVGFIWLIAY